MALGENFKFYTKYFIINFLSARNNMETKHWVILYVTQIQYFELTTHVIILVIKLTSESILENSTCVIFFIIFAYSQYLSKYLCLFVAKVQSYQQHKTIMYKQYYCFSWRKVFVYYCNDIGLYVSLLYFNMFCWLFSTR